VATQPPIEENQAQKSASHRLDSWKEIAAYLKRDIRTVQRWEENEGLPVHRHLHRRQGSVYAYKLELDAWWDNHASAISRDTDTTSIATDREPSPTESADPETNGNSPRAAIVEPTQQDQSRRPLSLPHWIPRRIPVPLWTASIVLVGGLVSTIVWGLGRHAGKVPVASVYLSGNELVALNSNGTKVWSHTYSHPPGSSHLYAPTPEVPCHGQEADALVSVAWNDGESHELDCFTNTGTLMWSFRPSSTLAFGSQTFSPPWVVQDLEVLRVNGEGRIAVALHHDVWWASMVVLLDTKGRTVGTFINSGWILSLKAVNASSGTLLLAGGSSNSGAGAMLAVLDPANLSGSSPERAGSVYECRICGPGRPLKYFIFPKSEVNIAAGTKLSFTDLDKSNDMIFARTQEARGSGRYENAEGIYTFSPDMNLVNAAYSDAYWYAHKDLETSGAIKHSANQCPDRFGPRRILSWDPQNRWKDIHPTAAQH
jgi:hypothetical protein